MKNRRINYFNGLDLMKMKILIHELLHMFENERVLSEEVHNESFSQDTRDSFQLAITSRPSFDSSIEHSSRPSFDGTSTTNYDGSRGEGTNDDSDTGNDGGDIADPQQSQYPLSSFTGEDDFTHATQDEDHGSRRASAGIGAIGKPYRERQQRMTPYNEDSFSTNFESMSIGTQFNDSLNEGNIFPPYTMSYGHPSLHPSSSCDAPNPTPEGVSSEGVTFRDCDSLTFSFSELTPVPVFSVICTISIITKILLHIHYTYHHSGVHYILYTYT